MFKSSEEREKIKDLEKKIRYLKNQLNQKYQHYSDLYSQQFPKWEFLSIDTENNKWDDVVELGTRGWEMVGISTFATGAQFKTVHTQYVFKRPVPQVIPDNIMDANREWLDIQNNINLLQTELNQLR